MADQGINYTVATVTVPFKADMTDVKRSLDDVEDRISKLPDKFSEALSKMADEFKAKIEAMKDQARTESNSSDSAAKIPTQQNDTMAADDKSSPIVVAVEKVEEQLKDVNMKVDTVNNLLLGIISGQ